MDYAKSLALTGPGIIIGGLLIEQSTLLAAGAALVGLGAAIIQFGVFRRGKKAFDA